MKLRESGKTCLYNNNRFDLSDCRFSVKDDSLTLFMPLNFYGLMCNQKEDVGIICEELRGVFNVGAVVVKPWHGIGSVELCVDDRDYFTQLTRAVLCRSNLFWDKDGVRLVVAKNMYNNALGDFVKGQIRKGVEEVAGFKLEISIQASKS